MTKAARGILFKIHGWIGAQLFLLLFFIVATGTLATISNEIDWLLNPQMRAAAHQGPLPWQAIHDQVQAAYPEHDITGISAPLQPGFAAEILTVAPDGAFVRVYADPATGAVQGTHGWITVQRFLRNLHMNMNLNTVGIYLVTVFGFVLLASLVTGLTAYKRFWRGFLRRPRTGESRRLMGDLHRLTGVWSIWFVALIGATGVWYLVEDAVDYRWERKAPEVPPGPGTRMIRIDEAVRRVEQAWPDFRIRYINLPSSLSSSITFGGQGSALLVRHRGNLVYVHPVTGDVLRIKDAAHVPAIERWIDTSDPLHFGDFGGLATKLLWFLFGCGLSFLSFSGFWLMLRRLRGAPARPQPRLAPPTMAEPCAAE
jgi:uncharacterized iron-regulated membrane protein